jgi:hypothetical protein
MADMARWLGGIAALEDPRPRKDTLQMLSGVAKDKREALTTTEKSKLKKFAEEGLEFKFKLLAPLDGSNKPTLEKLQGVYSVTIRVEELRTSLQKYDMDDVFLIASDWEHVAASDEDRPAVGARPIDLFTSYGDVSLETAKKASTFHQRRGQTYHVQNLLWSGTNILNSCDEELCKKIQEQIIGYPIEHKTGPVFFKLMMGMVQASSASTMRVLTQQLEALSIEDFDGESVISYVSIMRGVVEQLKNNNAVPRDSVQLIADGLKKTSTEDFASYISLLLNAHTSGIKLLTEEALLNEAEKMYMDLYARGKWDSGTGKDKQESVLFAGNCHKCGKAGHMAWD